ncbi:MAG: efflux RND transporter permease subunit, partial [Planctomycetota bacterium]|nr:efflux RND transporter permease subunit [Planctomycetota bacterium]
MTMDNLEKRPFLTRVVEVFLRGDIAILLTVVSLALGAAALYLTPREEEPQIIVPMADIFVSVPGLSAEAVERKVTSRLEKMIYQIDGVEYVYSMSRPGQSTVTARFYVGEDRENSLVKLYNKIHQNMDHIPPGVESWVIKPVEVDDVPIVNVTLWSDRPQLYGDHQLRRMAEELQNELQAVKNTNQVTVIGGRPRRIRVELDPARLASRKISALQVSQALRASNAQVRAGSFEQQDEQFVVEAGTFVQDARELEDLIIAISDNRPVYLKDVATIVDGPAEVDSYSWIGFGPTTQHPTTPKDEPATADNGLKIDDAQFNDGCLYPAVHIAVAKKKGSNAVWVADEVQRRMEELTATHLPDGVHYRITRDYGETANEKVGELIE